MVKMKQRFVVTHNSYDGGYGNMKTQTNVFDLSDPGHPMNFMGMVPRRKAVSEFKKRRGL